MSVTEEDLATTPIFAALTEEFGLERLFDESPDAEADEASNDESAAEPTAGGKHRDGE